jgi:HEPN domain-containing protein
VYRDALNRRVDRFDLSDVFNRLAHCTITLLNMRVANRFKDWLRQAEADLEHARHSYDSRDFEWSCFAAQQASEKALRSVFLNQGKDVSGHTDTILLGNLSESLSVPEDLFDCAKTLDKHYIPTRYPNGFDEGAPTDFYTEGESIQAMGCAERIIEYCRNQVH